LNADLMYKHIRTDTVWDLICQMRSQSQMRNQRRVTDVALNLALSHKVVMPSYTEPKKCVIVDRIRFDLTPQSTFLHKKTGQQITYANYFRTTYNITNSDLDEPQPLLESVSRRERDQEGNFKISHFIPSLCHLTGQTDDMKQDTRRARELIKKTAMVPNDRLSKIYNQLGNILRNPAFIGEFQKWGLQMSNKLLKIPARRLPTPAMKNGQSALSVKEFTESWDVKFKWPQFRSKSFTNWALLTFRQFPELHDFMDFLHRVGGDLNVPMDPPQMYVTQGLNANDYKHVIDSQISQQRPFLILIVLPRNAPEPYNSIKYHCSITCGVPTQFVTQLNISKDPLLKATKILLQMNCKVGGAPWTLDFKLLRPTGCKCPTNF
jgi:aubergine-like protein